MKRPDCEGVAAVVFDLFGTLVDNHSFPGHPSEEWRRTLTAMSAALSTDSAGFIHAWDDTWRSRATGAFPTMEACIGALRQRLGVDAPASAVRAAAELRMEYVRRSLVTRQDAVETLVALRSSGLALAVISNCGPDVPFLWESTPLAAHVDVPVFSNVVGLMKPDPRMYQLAFERLHVSPAQCLYVADGEGGELAAAAGLGMEAALIRSSYSDQPGVRRPHVEPWEGAEIAYLREVRAMV